MGRMTDEGGGEPAADPAFDPDLHYEEEEEEEEEEGEELGDTLKASETSSIVSDDSVYPCYTPAPCSGDQGELTLHQCCARNCAALLRDKLESGVTRQEAVQLDANGRNGLMVACYAGFLDIVVLLSGCPYVDINHQDNDGNTALMIAAQAGHDMIVNYLLNYYPGLEVEKRDARGLTALMKAAMQGCNNCVTALVLAGADLNAVDPVKGKTAREWAVFTGRFETIVQIRCLLQRPRAEQFSSEYLPEWPALPELVAKALATKTRGERMQEKIRSAFSFRFPRDPEVDGVMDHMVRMTTSLASPFVSTACRTICPLSPPEVGKRRLAVPEILRAQVPNAEPPAEAKTRSGAEELPGCSQPPALASSQPPGSMPSFLPLRLLRRSSIFPEDHVPRIKLTKPPAPPASAEEQLEESPDRNTLRLPKWRYKELREKRRAAKQLEEES